MTLRNLDRWVRGMRDGMVGLKKPQAAEVGRTLTIGSGQPRPSSCQPDTHRKCVADSWQAVQVDRAKGKGGCPRTAG